MLIMSGNNVNILRADIHMYKYSIPKKCLFAILPYAAVLSAYGLNKMRCKDAVLSYGIAMHLPTETMKLAFLFISLSGIFVFLSREMKLLSFFRISLCMVSKLLCIKMFSAYDNTFVLGNGIVTPYARREKDGRKFHQVRQRNDFDGRRSDPPAQRPNTSVRRSDTSVRVADVLFF